MANAIIKTKTDVSDEWAFYIENKAKSLAEQDDFAIQNYMDQEVFNPVMAAYLSEEKISTLLEQVVDSDAGELSLTFIEEKKGKRFLPDWLRPRFRKLKSKVRKIFCKVVRTIDDVDGDFDYKDLIKLVLLALIPAFAGGIPAAVLPLVIALVAELMRKGIAQTCPVG